MCNQQVNSQYAAVSNKQMAASRKERLEISKHIKAQNPEGREREQKAYCATGNSSLKQKAE